MSIGSGLVRRVREPKENAMKYLTFISHAELPSDTQPPAALMEAMGQFITREQATGALVDTGGLLPSTQGYRLRVSKRKLTITDGPFTESKEVIGGWAILQGTPEEVRRVATEFVELHRQHWPEFEFACEVRPMFDGHPG
jgi:hypothetical protein